MWPWSYVSHRFERRLKIMWIIQLLLAWALLYVAFRLMIGIGGKRSDNDRPPVGPKSGLPQSKSGYFRNAPDALRPDIEPDEFDPTDFM